MAEDWAVDVKKYAPAADDTVIAAIVKHCGIALRTRDASLVAFSDKKETDRVRDGYCRKKLALTESDAVVDKAIADVGKVMKADRTKNRVTVYYLLAEKFGKLDLLCQTPLQRPPSKLRRRKLPPKPPNPLLPPRLWSRQPRRLLLQRWCRRRRR